LEYKTPTEEEGELGSMYFDDEKLHIKTINGWKQINLN